MATLPNPHAWVAGDDATSGNLQTLTDAINFLKDPPRCHAFQNSAQSPASGTSFVAVTLDSETGEVDTDAMHSTVTNTSRFTAVTAGRYRFIGQVAFTNNATGIRAAGLRKNGTTVFAEQTHASAGTVTHYEQVVDEVLLSVGDYVELVCWQTSGGALALVTGAVATFMHAVWASVS